MEELMKLIEEYGKLENLLGYEVGSKGASSDKAAELRVKRTDKYCQLHLEILRISKKILDSEV